MHSREAEATPPVVLATRPHRGCTFLFSLSAFLVSLFFGLLQASLLAKPELDPPITPSFAKPVEVEVFTDGKVEIPLLANAQTRRTKFFIRSSPQQGTLGKIITTKEGTASVVYTHNPRFGAGADSFSYAVQNPGAAVSSRVVASIRVINRPPQVDPPPDMDFSVVPIGSSSRRVLTLRNSGGEKFIGSLLMPSPWQAEVSRVEIEPGSSADIPVIFSPDIERAFTGAWYLQGDGGTHGQFQGTGFVIFEVSETFLNLEPHLDGSRSSPLTIANKTSEPVELDFDCPAGIQPIAPVKIDAGGQVKLIVAVLPSHETGGRVIMTVRERRTSQPVEILFSPSPPHLVVESAIDFGQIKLGETVLYEVKVANDGGTPASVEVISPNWVRSDPTHFLVKPGERKQIHLEATPVGLGKFTDKVVLKYHKKAVEIAVTGQATATSQPATRSTVSTPPQISAGTIASTPSRPSINLAETMRQALQIKEIVQQDGFVSVRWYDPNPDARTYKIEYQQITSESSLAREAALAPNPEDEKFSTDQFVAERLKFTKIFEQAKKNDKVVKIWLPLEKVEIQDVGDQIFEAIFPVPPNERAMRIRISPVLADGTLFLAKTEIRIPLQQPIPRRWPVSTILWSMVALAAVVLAWRRLSMKLEGRRPR